MTRLSTRITTLTAAGLLLAAAFSSACDGGGGGTGGGTTASSSGTGGGTTASSSGTGGGTTSSSSGTGGGTTSCSSGTAGGGPCSEPPLAMPSNAKVILLHHSTGGVIYDDGDVDGWFAAYNASNESQYDITELAYPDAPYPWQNYPYDYWHLWVDGGGAAESEGQATIESLAADYDVVVFKHCFPVSGIEADSGNPDVASETKTIENYQLQYDALKGRLHAFPNTRFIVWTGAALLAAESDAEQGARSRQFFEWVKNSWDEQCDNIYVWDFFELETEGGNFLLPEHSAGDSHPNASFAVEVAPLFGTRVVDVIEGRGDACSLTGE